MLNDRSTGSSTSSSSAGLAQRIVAGCVVGSCIGAAIGIVVGYLTETLGDDLAFGLGPVHLTGIAMAIDGAAYGLLSGLPRKEVSSAHGGSPRPSGQPAE